MFHSYKCNKTFKKFSQDKKNELLKKSHFELLFKINKNNDFSCFLLSIVLIVISGHTI